MRSVVNGRLVVLPVLAAALALAACTSQTPGTGTPVTSSTGGDTSTASTGANGSGLAAIQPCDLLDSGVVSQNGLHDNGPSTDSGARSCGWQKPTGIDTPGYSIGVDIRDNQGVGDLATSGFAISDDPVGRHQAKLAKETNGDGCLVAISVTDSSRVDVTANTSAGDVDAACTLANQYAKLVEPKLP
jgi:uncharacterized protein DUF3558